MNPYWPLCEHILAITCAPISALPYSFSVINDVILISRCRDIKVRKRAKIRNRYNQVSYLTQDATGKVTNSQLDITNESQEVSPFPADDHKASINRRIRKNNFAQDRNNMNDPQKKYRLRKVNKNILLEGLNRFHNANLFLSSDEDQDT